jgi:hypothetical protein
MYIKREKKVEFYEQAVSTWNEIYERTFATINTFSTYVQKQGHGTMIQHLRYRYYDKKQVFNEGGGSVKNMQQFIR